MELVVVIIIAGKEVCRRRLQLFISLGVCAPIFFGVLVFHK